MEINPFHNGHLYFLKEVKKLAGDNPVVCVTSTNFVQRGEVSVLSKDIKTELLLKHGVDIVCELPCVLANQGGEYFAYSAIKILKQFNITNLVFGSESDDLNYLQSINLDSTINFTVGIHSNLNRLKSNDILAISYIQAAKQLSMNIDFQTVKRIENNYNDSIINNTISSASAIRANRHNLELISSQLPASSLDNMLSFDGDLLYSLFKVNLRNCIANNIDIFLSENGQLLNRMNYFLAKSKPHNLEQLIDLCKDKNNSKYKYQRIVINVILLVTNKDYNSLDYIRVLGFNPRASKLIPKSSFSSLADINNEISLIEIRASELFSLLTKNFQYNEFDRKPLIIQGV